MQDFCHLHCHTHYSLLDGAAQIGALVDSAKEHGSPALAITDHGNLFGVPEFAATAKKAGIKPIIGCEFYLSPSPMADRSDRTRYHQVLLAKDGEGYRNLIALSSLSYTEGYYYKPRIDRKTLREHSAGLVATTCCLQGEVPQTIMKKGEADARRVFEWYLDVFGEDYYIELQDHGIREQKRINPILLRWAQEYGVPAIATNDVHYVAEEDSAAQDVLLCLQTGRDLYDPKRMRFEGTQFYLKSPSEMLAAMGEIEEAAVRESTLVHTGEVAEKCTFEISTGELLLPHYPIPAEYGEDMNAYLRDLTYERALERFDEITEQIRERLDHELRIIGEMGYAGYFLIVQDFTSAARNQDVSVGPGRGSGAGSLVAYCLGITNIDPLRYGLIFERFLNPERVSMPDFDIDFDDRGRSKVIDYVVQKYGRQSVCQIITFGTMGARSVIRDVSRVLGIPLAEADRIAKLIPEGVKVSIESAMKDVPEFRKLAHDENDQIRKLMHYAKVLEGSARHTGVHAAGVIIAPGDVADYVPVAIAKGKSGGEDVMTTQYDGKWVESFGLLKMDFLGLKTLTVLNDALALIRENHDVEIDLDDLPMDDAKTMALFQHADTVAIFQFESDGMREWLRKLRPTSIDDLIAMNALYRPGPMDLIPNYVARKHGKEEVSYPHPILEQILKPTYGIPVYQEQVMQIAQVMAGYTPGAADILRRAMGKKKQSEMDKQRTIFVEGARERDVEEKVANGVFDMMAKFAGYGFNKSHSAAYSVVAYQTAYLKAHYPAEFMAAAMTNEMHDTKKLAVVLEEARKLGLQMRSASVNRSMAHFTVEEGDIRFGLGAIKGVGLGAIEAIVEAREKDGPFATIFEMTKHVDLKAVNKKTVECLARVGALDDFEGHRAQLVESVDNAVTYGQRIQAERAAGQSSLFGTATGTAETLEPSMPVVEPWPRARRLKEERELIGVYVSGHPLEEFLAEARAFTTSQLGRLEEFETDEGGRSAGPGPDGRPQFSFCGIITGVQRRTTKTGKPIAFATIEDFTGQGELVCFSTVLDRVQNYLQVDEIVIAKGRPEVRGGGLSIIVQDVLPMWKVREQMVKSIVVRVDAESLAVEAINQLRELCDANRGSVKLYFDIASVDMPAPQRVHARKFVVDPTPDLMRGLTRLVGPGNVVVEGEA
jgi:DNA polymerase-3 subunit alpha